MIKIICYNVTMVKRDIFSKYILIEGEDDWNEEIK